MFPEILHVFYGIVTFFCITFDALQMRLIVTDVVLTITIDLIVTDGSSTITIICLAVTGGGSTGKCGRLSQPGWLLVRTIIQSYLIT